LVLNAFIFLKKEGKGENGRNGSLFPHLLITKTRKLAVI
jgi:hypothetical protein